MERKKDIDITKGILIISVVIGHTAIVIPWFDVYWFHMPGFFMISGYFYKKIPTGSFWMKFKNNVKRYAIPYFSFCIFMFLLSLLVPFYTHTPVIKYLGKTLLAGLFNITWFSYPFWFINTLLCSIVVMNLFDTVKIKWLICTALFLFAFTYLPIYKNLNTPLPWGVDCMFVSILYMVIGYSFNNYKYKRWHNILFIIPVLFIVIVAITGFKYRLDIAAKELNNPLLDVIIPVSIFYCIWRISYWISKIPVVSDVFILLGQCCMTIFFVHAFCIGILKNIGAPITIQVVIGLILGIILHRIFSRNKCTSILFLGRPKQING